MLTNSFPKPPLVCLASVVIAAFVGVPTYARANVTGDENTAAPSSAATVATTNAGATLIPASDLRFVYEGRFDQSDPAQPVVIWQTSRIRFGFEGDAIALRFSDLKGQVFFNAAVDNHTSVVALRGDGAPRTVTLRGFGAGRHQLVLFKRSEATAGTVRFLGVDVQAAAQISPGVRPHYAMRMLFLGDSITVGACNEDGPADQWQDRGTHNAALSWAAMTADAFEADHRNIAVSGMGISTGWFDQPAASIWDRLYPASQSPAANLSTWMPDMVFVNFGENDDSFTRAHQQPFPADFTQRYVAFVRAVRQTFPRAEIALLRGGMTGGATSKPLQLAWESAVRELRASDPRVKAFAFQHWSKNHPRVADDRAMADELIAWLHQNP